MKYLDKNQAKAVFNACSALTDNFDWVKLQLRSDGNQTLFVQFHEDTIEIRLQSDSEFYESLSAFARAYSLKGEK